MHRLHPAGLLGFRLDAVLAREVEQVEAESRSSATKRSPAAPWRRTMSSGSGRDSVGITWPLLRPEAPQPGSTASTTATSTPAPRRCSAVDSPVKPAPMTMTSAAAVPISSGNSGPGGVTAAHSESGQRTFAVSIVMLSLPSMIWLA